MTLKELRAEHGITLRRLSEMSGLGLSTIGNYENGKTAISGRSLKKLAAALGVSPDALRDPASAVRGPLAGRQTHGSFKMEAQVVEEVRVRIEQFPSASPEARQIYAEQIVARLREYGDWCANHHHAPEESLPGRSRDKVVAPVSRGAGKEKRARLRDIDTVSVAVFGNIPAGWPQHGEGEVEPVRRERVRRGQFPPGAFGLDVRGNSMNAARHPLGPILDGQTVILLPPALRPPGHGDIVAALCDGMTTLKRLDYQLGPGCLLRAESDDPDCQATVKHETWLEIQGVVIGKL